MAGVSTVRGEGVTRVDEPLRRAAARASRYFGSAARIDQIDQDPRLREALLADCAALTPEIHLKWNAVEPAAGRYDFAPADGLVAFAARHGIAVRGHTLLWEQSTPAWARETIATDRDWRIVQHWFATVMPRYQHAIRQWDVVNEPIDTEHGERDLRRTTFHRAFGADYVPRALNEARLLAPDAALFINDYGFDYDNPVEEDRRRALLRLVERLKKSGTPLDGIGIQAHLDLSKGPINQTRIARFLGEIAAMELDIVITELDVKEHDLSARLDLRDRRVAAEVGAYLAVALDQPAVKGVVTWGLSDRHSWLQDPARREETPAALNRGLPYDAVLDRKPMYWTIRDAFLRGGRAMA